MFCVSRTEDVYRNLEGVLETIRMRLTGIEAAQRRLRGLRSARPPPPARPHKGGGGNAREFDGKVAVVTGGGAGIGYAIARAFAREGAWVAIAGRTNETLIGAAEAIEEECGRPVLPVPADVAKAEDCERLIAATVERFGAVDILVNNAALFACSAAD